MYFKPMHGVGTSVKVILAMLLVVMLGRSQAQSARTDLVLSAIRAGQSDAPGTKRDLAAVFAWLKAAKPDEYKTLVGAVAAATSAEASAASLFAAAKTQAEEPGQKTFGPVDAQDSGATERFAVLCDVAKVLRQPHLFWDAVRQTAQVSGLTPATIKFAKRTQEELGSDKYDGGLWWRDEFAPAILQTRRDDPQLLAAAHGKDLPDIWREAASWLRPWIDQRHFMPGKEDGFYAPLAGGYRPAASHPLALALLRSRLYSSLDDQGTRQIFDWLAREAQQDPVAIFGAGLFILDAATQEGVSVGASGDLTGDRFWKGVSRLVLERTILGNDDGTQFTAWKGKYELLNSLYNGTERAHTPILGTRDFADALFLFGQGHMLDAWAAFNTGALNRSDKLLSQRVGEELRTGAQRDRDMLFSTLANPLCAPWLTRAASKNPSRSLEATNTIQSYLQSAASRDLAHALFYALEPVLAQNEPEAQADDKKFDLVESLDPWIQLRGTWVTTTAGTGNSVELPSSPWAAISEADLVRHYSGRASAWINSPNGDPDEGVRRNIGVLSWFGMPGAEATERLSSALSKAVNSGGVSEKQKSFLISARLSLTVSTVLAGAEMEEALSDQPLMDTSEIVKLPTWVAQIYKSGTPIGARTSVDTAWILALQSSVLEAGSDYDFDGKQSAEQRVRNVHLRQIARQSISVLDGYLNIGLARLNSGQRQTGVAITLAELQASLSEGLSDADKNPLLTRRQSLERVAANGVSASSAGTSYFGLEGWFEHWERQIARLNRLRMLTIKPVPFDSAKLQSSVCGYLAGTAALVSQDRSQLPLIAWSEPKYWASRLSQDNPATHDHNLPHVRMLPWTKSREGASGLLGLMGRASADEADSSSFSAAYDIDHLDGHYWPGSTWAGATNELAEQTNQIRRLEQSLKDEYSAATLVASIDSLKPLLAAPLVTNLAGFEHELASSIADMRRAESQLRTAHEESIAADLEIKAQQILTSVYSLEKQRTDALLEIQANAVKLADLGKQIADNNHRKAELEVDKATNAKEIARIDQQIADLNKQQQTIRVKTAARAVAVLQNQLTLLQNLICTPTPNPHPDGGPATFAGQLGLIAYDASKKVTEKLSEINAQKSDLEHQLQEQQESSFFKAIGRFVGAVVGFVIAGPAGIQMGAMAGEAVGGIVAQIKQGKPFGQVFDSFLQSGVRIAAASGFDGTALQSGLGLKKGELAGLIGQGEQMLGPVFKDLPSFIDKNTLQAALVLNTSDANVRNLLDNVKAGLVEQLQQSLPRDQLGPLVGALPNVVLSGSPEQLKMGLEKTIESKLADLPLSDDLKSAARALGAVISQETSETELKNQIAEKLATLVVIKSVPSLDDLRVDLLQKLMISTTALQDSLRAGRFTSVKTALQGAQLIGKLGDQYSTQVQWMRGQLASVQVQAGQELAWSEIEPKIRKAVGELLPADPERLEFAVAQFQQQLDGNGMQAEIQSMLNPWNNAFQGKMTAVQIILDQPCGGDLNCGIAHLTDAGQKMQNLLAWLRDGDSDEYKDLRQKVSAKQAELQTAQDNLDVNKLDLEKAKQALVRSGFVRKQADLDLAISKIGDAVASLARQQSAILVSNSELELRRARLLQEQDALNELSSRTRTDALGARYKAALAAEDAAKQELTRTAEAVAASESRATVQRKIRAWYESASNGEANQLGRIESLLEQRSSHISNAARSVRNLLRLLRVTGCDSSGFAPVSSGSTWGERFDLINAELKTRFSCLGGFQLPPPRIVDLDQGQISRLFSKEGLTLYIEQVPPEQIGPLTEEQVNQDIIPIGPQQVYQRVFMALLMAENSNGQPSIQTNWTLDPIQHGPFAPYLVKEGNTWRGEYLVTSSTLRMTINSWATRIPDERSDDQILNHVITVFGVGDWAGAMDKKTFQSRPGVPLTGAYHLHIAGAPPAKARLVLVYTQPE